MIVEWRLFCVGTETKPSVLALLRNQAGLILRPPYREAWHRTKPTAAPALSRRRAPGPGPWAVSAALVVAVPETSTVICPRDDGHRAQHKWLSLFLYF